MNVQFAPDVVPIPVESLCHARAVLKAYKNKKPLDGEPRLFSRCLEEDYEPELVALGLVLPEGKSRQEEIDIWFHILCALAVCVVVVQSNF